MASFREALEELGENDQQKTAGQLAAKENIEADEEQQVKEVKKKSQAKKTDPIKIIVDSREKNSKILFYLKKQGIDLEFRQLDCGDYVLSDRVAVEYKKGEDLLSSIIDGRLFEQLGTLQNSYQIPILIIEGFPSGGIHPEAIAGAIASFMIDFGVSIIQTQNSEETAVLLKRLATREQKTKKRRALVRKASRIGNPKENAVRVVSSFPGINRTISTRLLETFGSIRGVIEATKEELVQVEGFGPKKSEDFLKIVDTNCAD